MACRMHSGRSMPRIARDLPGQGLFHLIARGNNRCRVFRNQRDFKMFHAAACRYTREFNIAVHHYALMHTHFHFLAWVEDTSELANFMKGMLLSYQHYCHRRYEYRGHLWQGRYRSIAIGSDEQWLQCARYIELNSVFAGRYNDPQKDRWTSYRYYADGAKDPLISQKLELAGIPQWESGKTDAMYRDFIVAGIDLDYRQLKREFDSERSQSLFQPSWKFQNAAKRVEKSKSSLSGNVPKK